MNSEHPFPAKKIWLWCLIVLCGLLTAYLGFVSLVSVWVGLGHMHQAGFWVPVLAGTLSLMGIFWLYFRLARYLFRHMREENIVNL
jgi:hypothetical protein